MYEVVNNRHIDHNTRVFVYFNLHKHVFSVKALSGPYKGLVVLHSSMLAMKDCEFRVQQAGRLKVIATKCKNVHAGVVGYLIDNVEGCTLGVTYDPYKYESFVERLTLTPIENAAKAFLENKRVYVSNNEQEYTLF